MLFAFARESCARIRIRSHHVATFWVSDRSPILSSTWQWIAFPRDPTGALRSRRHSCSDPGELGHLPEGCSPWGAQTRWLGTSERAWVRPGGDPGPFDRCLLLTDVVFKDDRPTSRHTSHRLFPRDTRACGFTPQGPLRRTVGSRQGVVFPSRRFRRRTSDAPSLAGSPGGTQCPSASARDRSRDLRS